MATGDVALSNATGPDMRTVVIGCRHNTATFVRRWLEDGLAIEAIVTIGEDVAQRNGVPHWFDLKEAFRDRCEIITLNRYDTRHDDDVAALSDVTADLGFCIGWQRLLPDFFLDRFQVGVHGMHCTPKLLPYGRGRSPLNWALIEGERELFANFFRYSAGVDDGPVFSAVRTPVMSDDDIATLQLRMLMIYEEQARRLYDMALAGSVRYSSQLGTGGLDRVYAKRTADDGRMDLRLGMRELSNFVRAQTRPYPGAFLEIEESRHRVWRCLPFPLCASDPYRGHAPGRLFERFEDGSVAVTCGDGHLLLTDHELPKHLGRNFVIQAG